MATLSLCRWRPWVTPWRHIAAARSGRLLSASLAWRHGRFRCHLVVKFGLPGAAASLGSMRGIVEAVSQRRGHHFSKLPAMWITLLAGLGVDGDGACRHDGEAPVQGRARSVATEPAAGASAAPASFLEELEAKGFAVGPGQIGENILTRGIDLLGVPADSVLRIGDAARVRVTGLRNPCVQLDRFVPGLMAATLERDATGGLVRKAGIMAVVLQGGVVRPGDPIEVVLPPEPYRRLVPV